MAKLVLEVQSRETETESLDDSVIKQEENEDTPKVHVSYKSQSIKTHGIGERYYEKCLIL